MAKRYICETFEDDYKGQYVTKSAHEKLRTYLEAFDGELHLEAAFERHNGVLVAVLWTEEANEV